MLAQSFAQGHVLPAYQQNDPAPIGLAYYGLSANPNGNGSVLPSLLNSSRLMATFDPNATGVRPNYPFSSAPDGYGLQLNAVTTNVSLFGTSHYSFWTQNVVSYFAETHQLRLISNVWNFSSAALNLSSNVFYAHGPLGHQVGTSFYYAEYSVPTPVAYPFNLTLWMNNSIVFGRNAVDFTVALSNATATQVYAYDFVVFNSTTSTSPPATLSQYAANGFQLNPVGLTDDFEVVLGGPGGGRQADLYAADANMTLSYWNASAAAFRSVPSAFSYGGETAETVTGAYVGWQNGTSGAPYGVVRTGPAMLNGLWNASGATGLGEVSIALSPEDAFLFFAPNWTSNFTYEGRDYWAPQETTSDTFWLAPGAYNFTAELSGYTPVSVGVSVGPGTTVVIAHLALNSTEGIYTPLWAWNNNQFAGIASAGSGTPSDPYQIMNSQTFLMGSVFGTLNDLSFPVFAGVFFDDTTASVVMSHMPPLLTNMPYTTTPSSNQLGYVLENTTDVALVNSSQLSGWFTTSVDLPAPIHYAGNSYGTFSVVLWRSSGDLIANDSFLTQSGGLSMYGGSNNTVWGNEFTMVPFPIFPSAPFGLNLSLGLEEAESGDLVYDNGFDTTVTAVTEPFDLYSSGPLVPRDTWNITPTPAATVGFAPNFPDLPLTGTFIGNATQGGNFWWDYGGAANPVGTLPYTEVVGGTSQILLGGDHYPLVPNPPSTFPVTFTETGLPSGTSWSVSVVGLRTSTSPTIVVNLSNGTYPYTVGVIPGYVAAPLNGNLSVSGTASNVLITFTAFNFSIDFHETGLPTGTGWVVVVSGTHYAGSGARITVSEPNGTYEYTVPPVPGFTPLPTSGNVTVANHSARVTITFSPFLYSVVFTQSGLTGTSWSVNLSGTVEVSSGPNQTFHEPNGTYGFTVGPVPGYQAVPASGPLTVAGAPTAQSIVFTPLPPGEFTVGFSETGLPAGTNWSVDLGGAHNSSTGPSVLFLEPNGTYAFTVGTVPGYLASPTSGPVTVQGGATTVPVVFTAVRYNVTFTASGLPPGTNWSVILGGLPEMSNESSLTFVEPNGSYSYTVTSIAGYTASPSSGTVDVTGRDRSLFIDFSPLVPGRYSVTFEESGLVAGTPWSITVGSVTYPSTGTTIVLSETNGTYAFAIRTIAGYSESPSSGIVFVTGGNVYETVAFSAVPPLQYTITFSERGLPNGTNWSVTLAGATEASHTSAITFQEVNGTYRFAVGTPGGFVASPGSGSVLLTGGGQYVVLTFAPPGRAPPTFGGAWTLAGQVGAIVAVVVLFLALVVRVRRGGPGSIGVGTPPGTKEGNSGTTLPAEPGPPLDERAGP